MKKFLIGFILMCGVMFNFNLVGHCLTQQTKESVYLHIPNDSCIAQEIERQIKDLPNVELEEEWYKKATVFKKIIDTKPLVEASREREVRPAIVAPYFRIFREVVPSGEADDESSQVPVPVNAILQNEKELSLFVPTRGDSSGLGHRFSGLLNGYFQKPQAALFCIKLKDSSKRVEEAINERTPEHVQEVRFIEVSPASPYEEELRLMEEQLQASSDASLFALNTENVKIIPVSIGTCACGYLLIPNEEQALDQSFIWFTRPLSGYEGRKFYILKSVLYGYWDGMKLKEEMFKAPSYEFPIPS